MTEIENLINDLNKIIESINSLLKSSRPVNIGVSFMGFDASLKIKTINFENYIRDVNMQFYKRLEPLIDIIESKGSIKVIVTLPRIKKEDVWFKARKGILDLQINKYGQVYKKEIPCDVSPSKIRVIETTVNNSVLEIVFNMKKPIYNI